jgi:23S rRNA pseudouridine2605 synthase
MSQSPFQKFTNKKKNSAVKEGFRQEKKKAKKERAAYFDKVKEEKYQARMAAKNPALAAKRNDEKAKAVTKEKISTNKDGKPTGKSTKGNPPTGIMPLNKYLAHCGVCSRRDAVTIIAEGNVKVNGTIAKEPGYKVLDTDEVIYNGKKLFVTKNLQYILLNKPKDYITTTDDPQGRKTVLQLIKSATEERVYPIGRLDRNQFVKIRKEIIKYLGNAISAPLGPFYYIGPTVIQCIII